jgi:hypothetical protein
MSHSFIGPSRSNKIASSGKLILVTGTSDFIATHILATQQRNGYCVRGVVWSQTSGNTALKKLSENSDKLSVVIVHNMTALGAFDEAVKSMDGARKFQLSSAQLAPKMWVLRFQLTSLTTSMRPGSTHHKSIHAQH